MGTAQEETSGRRLAEGILYTDQYQLTMAQLYFRSGLHEMPAHFDHFFRNYPDYGQHQAGYCINAGLAWLLDWMQSVRFGEAELAKMRGMIGRRGEPLFGEDFLAWLAEHGDFSRLRVRAVPEGRVVHPTEPVTVVQGPLALAQILESPLLNLLNYQTLIATKASRVKSAARGRPVLEFGMRRAQERGANAGARAALIGGADFSSNAGISHTLGFPPKGTHAHSMVQAFMALGEGELGAFRAYAEAYPDDCLLLVDTIDTLQSGLPNAIRVFEELRQDGHAPIGIRLDSGDLAHLTVRSAKMLDEAGFPQTSIVLSNQLDEQVIHQILDQIGEEAPRYGVDPEALLARLIFGVGTRLITSRGAAALNGVYKLVAIKPRDGWAPAIKLSETPAKTLNPDDKQVWRIYDRRGNATADLLCRIDEDPRTAEALTLHHPTDPEQTRTLRREQIESMHPLLEEVREPGGPWPEGATFDEMRSRREADLQRLDPGVRRLINPHVYHVSLSDRIWQKKQELIHAFQTGAEETTKPDG
jgi:nicotinate phosphoribosyltransferase